MLNRFLALVLIFVNVGPAAASGKEDATSVMQRWIDGFNKGDVRSAISMCANQTSMIDDFPPHEWHGPGACKRWFADFQSMCKVQGISNSRIAVEPASHTEMTKEFGYMVFPAKLSFNRKGTSAADNGILTVTLHNGTTGWRITGWAWSDE